MNKYNLSRNILILVGILNLLMFSNGGAQGETFCRTVPPTRERLEELGISRTRQSPLDEVIIRIFLHIVRDTNGNGLTFDEAMNAITIMAADFEDVNIYFYLTGTEVIENNDYYNYQSNDFCGLTGENPHDNAIDIYLVNDETLSPEPYAAHARGVPGLALVLGGTREGISLIGTSVLTHEMGHCLGLYETWWGHCEVSGMLCGEFIPQDYCPEVPGGDCTECGDYLCDTPADPNIEFNVNSNCQWNGTSVCDQGYTYNPLTRNFMAYTTPQCMSSFTPDQINRMFNIIEKDPNFELVAIIPPQSSPTPNAPSNLRISNNSGHPKLKWNKSTTTDIVGYKAYRNLFGCGPSCGSYTYIGYTVGDEANTYTDWQVDYYQGKWPPNVAWYYVKAFAKDLQTESTRTNKRSVGTSQAEKRLTDDLAPSIPAEFALKQNHPNPFNPSTIIHYDLPEWSYVEMRIYDMMGREIRTLIDRNQDAGYNTVIWDGKDSRGDAVSSGVYMYRLDTLSYESERGFHLARKMVLLR